MIKTLILLAIIALTTYVGYLLSRSKKQAFSFWNELYELNEELLLNMKFNRNSLNGILAKYQYVSRALNSKLSLANNDIEFLNDYVKNLGKTDALSQSEYLFKRRDEIKDRRDKCALQSEKYGSMYVKIAFLTGVLIAIILI